VIINRFEISMFCRCKTAMYVARASPISQSDIFVQERIVETNQITVRTHFQRKKRSTEVLSVNPDRTGVLRLRSKKNEGTDSDDD